MIVRKIVWHFLVCFMKKYLAKLKKYCTGEIIMYSDGCILSWSCSASKAKKKNNNKIIIRSLDV